MNASATVRVRDPYLDNAKCVLVTLVVVGHMIADVGVGATDAAYKWIYAFHMPAFVLISGYLTRNYRGTPRQSLNLVTALLTPYVVVNVVQALESAARGDGFALNLFKPSFASWYLLALFAWRLLTPVLRVVPFVLPLSVLVSLAAVTYHGIGQDLSAARIVSFLPFFTLGLLLTPQHLAAFSQMTAPWRVRAAATLFLVVAFVVIAAEHAHIKKVWLFMYGHVDSYGTDGNPGNLAVRAGVLLTATAMTAAVLAVIPRGRSALTTVGANSMYVYVLQSIIVYALLPSIERYHGWSTGKGIALAVISVGGALILGSPLIRSLTRWLVDPFGTFPALQRIAQRKLPAEAPGVATVGR